MEIQLTPIELYFLVRALGGDKIDYDYVAAMEDISINFSVQESKALSSLTSKGLAHEDFDGVYVLDGVKEYLSPLLESINIATISVLDMKEHRIDKKFKIHFGNKSILRVDFIGDTIEIKDTLIDEIEIFFSDLFASYEDGENIEIDADDVDEEKLKKAILCKVYKSNRTPDVVVVYDIEGKLFASVDENKLLKVDVHDVIDSFLKAMEV